MLIWLYEKTKEVDVKEVNGSKQKEVEEAKSMCVHGYSVV